MVWIYCLKNHNEITMYSLVKSWFSPSDSSEAFGKGPSSSEVTTGETLASLQRQSLLVMLLI
jgi:hypothetical protein